MTVMSEQAIQLFPVCPQRMGGTLIPALKGCPSCGAVEEIVSPALGICPGCGTAMRVLSASQI
jgi:hypothetical protein